MSKCYFELRKQAKLGQLNLAADMMRHLHTRQYLGKTVVICEHPALLLLSAHKHWLKLSRTIQRQRLNTNSADKILKFTHTITHMQQMRFTDKTPLEDPEADVYFIRKDQLDLMPARCFSVYLTTSLPVDFAADMLMQLPADALIIDYEQATPWRTKLGVESKKTLEEQVASQWHSLQAFLKSYDIDISKIFDGYLPDVERMDNALDTLLGVSHKFMQVANTFNDTLKLARPMRVSKNVRQQYDAFFLLAHRVQALSSIGFSQRFLETYSEDDTFFMYDRGRIYLRREAGIGLETLSEAISRHIQAGHRNLARALSAYSS